MSSDSESDAPKSKSKKRAAKKDDSSSDEGVVDKLPVKKSRNPAAPKTMKNADGEEMFEIGKMRFVTVRAFKGKSLVDIREFYEDASGAIKPGKKGISLSREQYEQLKQLSPAIDEKLATI
ncbi:hypothetical protein AB6A40_001558 [Gnathostoma spinigerum]|uniref:Transcriptional coactivator p15 (PC4) C-terminal domain-containing protein n=1 Tax=Gnathostoma spinigerum TaxID=75299 RepID=A0ABD6E4F7_9BILA